MAESISEFRSLIDRLARVGVIFNDGDKIHSLLKGLPEA